MNHPKAFKVLVVGADRTYKSSLCKILSTQSLPGNYIHTVGINIYRSTAYNRSVIYWDIPYAEFKLGRNLSLIKERADGVIVMINRDVESSIDAARDWVKYFAMENVQILLVNDKDDAELIEICKDITEQFQKDNNIKTCTMAISKKKGVFESINAFIDRIKRNTSEITLSQTMETQEDSACASLKPSPSPRFSTFSPASFVNPSVPSLVCVYSFKII